MEIYNAENRFFAGIRKPNTGWKKLLGVILIL